MTTLNIELFEALKAAGVADELAQKAAVAVADSGAAVSRMETKQAELKGDMEHRLVSEFSGVKSDLRLLKWMMGFCLAFVMAVLYKLVFV